MNRIIVGILGAALVAGPALAKGKHPNIGAAHQLVKQAIQRSAPRRERTSTSWAATLPKPRSCSSRPRS